MFTKYLDDNNESADEASASDGGDWFAGNPFAALRETDDMMAKPVQADFETASDDSSSNTDYTDIEEPEPPEFLLLPPCPPRPPRPPVKPTAAEPYDIGEVI